MKFTIGENEIEMEPETKHDRLVLERLHQAQTVTVKDGKTTDRNYPPSNSKTNVILVLPDPNKW